MSDLLRTGLIGAAALAFVAGGGYYLETRTPSPAKASAAPANGLVLPEDGCTDQVVLKVVQSLRQEPTKWEADGYNFERGMGWFDGDPLRIWVANGIDGLDFNISDSRFSQNGIKYAFTDECRVLLWKETSSHNRSLVNEVVK